MTRFPTGCHGGQCQDPAPLRDRQHILLRGRAEARVDRQALPGGSRPRWGCRLRDPLRSASGQPRCPAPGLARSLPRDRGTGGLLPTGGACHFPRTRLIVVGFLFCFRFCSLFILREGRSRERGRVHGWAGPGGVVAVTGAGQGRGLPSSTHSRRHLPGSLLDSSYGPQRKTLAEDEGFVSLVLGPWGDCRTIPGSFSCVSPGLLPHCGAARGVWHPK